MLEKPSIDNAPGIVWKARKGQWVATWQARSDLAKLGFRPTTVPLWRGIEPSDLDRIYISEQCQRIQGEMLVWGRGGVPHVGQFDGSLHSLANCYQTDPDSTYRKLRFRSRQYYDVLIRRLLKDHAHEQIADIKARHAIRWHAEWSAGGKVAMGHSMVGMLRTLTTFGATILEDAECARLSLVLSKMRFEMAKPRKERILAEQAIAIRRHAHEIGLHSLALAQAFQFELMLRQKDVIGEWTPMGEPGTSDVTQGVSKWLRGIRWSEIDEKLILRHTTSKRGKDIEVNLRLAPMVMEELERLGEIPTTGPVIVFETTGQPYQAQQFRRAWRDAATAVGIPKKVFNMDSRAGGITEATDAGAELEHVRHAATHSDISMTQRYSRGGVEKTGNVMRMRVAHRNKGGTT